MIKHYEITIGQKEDFRPNASTAYRLYSALLSAVPYEYADGLHNQEITPIAQHLSFSGRKIQWHISLFGENSCEYFGDILDNNDGINTDDGRIVFEDKHSSIIMNDSELLQKAAMQPDSDIWVLRIDSPTTFKSSGEYVLFPSVELIINSMVQRLNALCESIAIDDDEAISMLKGGVRIASYQLNSAPFYIKGQCISGFIGRLSLRTRLSPPMMELWRLLACFSGYSGIGIKPALGMGGVCAIPVRKK